MDLNTSHVTVPLLDALRISVVYGGFKYIPCYGSTHSLCFEPYYFSHLNTSHVTVPLLFSVSVVDISSNLNTSHVTVPLIGVLTYEDGSVEFKYIPCYGSTNLCAVDSGYNTEFKYIPCYGSTLSRVPDSQTLQQFKYIPCYGSTMANGEIGSRLMYLNTSHVTVPLNSKISRNISEFI